MAWLLTEAAREQRPAKRKARDESMSNPNRKALVVLSLGLLLGGCAAMPTQQERADAMMRDLKAQSDAVEHDFDKCGTFDLACTEQVVAAHEEQQANNDRWRAEDEANRQRQQ